MFSGHPVLKGRGRSRLFLGKKSLLKPFTHRGVIDFEQAPGEDDRNEEDSGGDRDVLPKRSGVVLGHPVQLHIYQRKMSDVKRV